MGAGRQSEPPSGMCLEPRGCSGKEPHEKFFEEKYVKTEAGNLRYLEAGDRDLPHILALHGLGGCAERWTGLMPFLSMRYHVVAPDLIGFGYSDKPACHYTPDFFSGSVIDLIDCLGMEQADIIGSSLGGQIAAHCAVIGKERVGKLVLVSPSGTLQDQTPVLTAYFAAAIYPTFELVRHAYQMMGGNRVTVRAEDVHRFIEIISQPNSMLAFMSTALSFKKSSIMPHLPLIACPTLLVWGRHDMMIPISCAGPFVREIRNCRFEIMDCGHLPQVEDPEGFSSLVMDFLGR